MIAITTATTINNSLIAGRQRGEPGRREGGRGERPRGDRPGMSYYMI